MPNLFNTTTASVRGGKSSWEDLGEQDPFWAVLTDLPRNQAHDKAGFFATGVEEVAGMLREAERLGLPAQRDAALDFGCGLGRLTRALAGRFDHCTGVDVATSMVERARALNADRENCEFIPNDQPNLALFDDAQFDLIYTARVLQHVGDRNLMKAYVSEFIRVLKPGGLLVFQAPSHIRPINRLQPRRRLFKALRTAGVGERTLLRRLRLTPMRMEFIPPAEVEALIRARGARVLQVKPDDMCGPKIESRTYFVTQ